MRSFSSIQYSKVGNGGISFSKLPMYWIICKMYITCSVEIVSFSCFSLFIRNGGKIDSMLFEEKKLELTTTHQQGFSPIICWDLKIFRDGTYKIMSINKIRQVKYIQRWCILHEYQPTHMVHIFKRVAFKSCSEVLSHWSCLACAQELLNQPCPFWSKRRSRLMMCPWDSDAWHAWIWHADEPYPHAHV